MDMDFDDDVSDIPVVGPLLLAIVFWASIVGSMFFLVSISGCKAQYGSNGGDSSETNNAEDGSVVNAQETTVGGDVVVSGDGGFATGGSIGVGNELNAGDRLVSCQDFKLPDGPLGSFWKPISDNDGKLAVGFDQDLFLEADDGDLIPFVSVTAFLANAIVDEVDGNEVVVASGPEVLSFSGFGADENDEAEVRGVYRGKYPGGFYNGNLVIDVGAGQRCQITISGDPGERVD